MKYVRQFLIILAIPLYEQRALLKKHYKAVLCGLLAGAMSGLAIAVSGIITVICVSAFAGLI